jgi:hypothetical protein
MENNKDLEDIQKLVRNLGGDIAEARLAVDDMCRQSEEATLFWQRMRELFHRVYPT